MLKSRFVLILAAMMVVSTLSAQMIEGYAYETGNRGYLNVVKVDLVNKATGTVEQSTFSELDGSFLLELPPSGTYELRASKDMFEDKVITLDRAEESNGKIFVKMEMQREPGYLFEVTLAPKREDEDTVVDGIKGARVEVYNNTTKEPTMVIESNPTPEFRLNLEKGNHYTILVRKEGYIAKRMEAHVNVDGCILCFDGVGEVKPGVSDNLSEGNDMGVLLANVEMEPSFEGKKMNIRNLYYDYNKSSLRKESREELRNLINIMQDNPSIAVEIGSHTDSRGRSEYNLELSEARAQAVVDYITINSDVRANRLLAHGYGESQLVNECADGVTCSEEKHQENRRTELTIIGKSKEVRFKTLEEMKKEEEMMEMITSLDGSGQIKVQSEEELKKILEEQGDDSRIVTSTVEDRTDEELEKHRNKVAKAKDSLEQAQLNKNHMLREALPSEVDQVERNMPEAKKTPDVPPIKFTGGRLARDADGELLTGYMVVIRESDQPLPEDNAIFSNHSSIYSYRSDEGKFWYMLGRYPTKDSAEREVKAFLKTAYPEARIVNFVDGEVKTTGF